MADEIKLKAPTVEQQVVVNIQGEEKLRSFADTLDKMSKGRNLQKYWKEQETLIKDVVSAYEKFGRVANEDTASELLKTANALKAMGNADISSLSPALSNVSSALQKAESVAGHLVDSFSVNAFKDAFNAFETLQAYGVDIQKLFTHFKINTDVDKLVADLEIANNTISNLTIKTKQLQERLDDSESGNGIRAVREECENLRFEIENIRSEAADTFSAFLTSNNINANSYQYEDFFERIREGSLTAQEAIAEFKRDYSYLLDNDASFDITQLQDFSRRLDDVSVKIIEISNKLDDISLNGVKVSNENVSGNFEELANVITEIENTNVNANTANIYDALSKILITIREIGQTDTDNIYHLYSTIRNLAQLNDLKINKASLDNLADCLERICKLDNTSSLSSLSLVDFKKFNDLHISKASLNNLAEYLPLIAGINVEKLIELTKIDFSHLNDFKIDKVALESLKQFANSLRDVFQGSNTDTESVKEASIAKNDFASANERVQSSVDESKIRLESEAESFERIARSARDASKAKSEFVSANKNVNNSAESSQIKDVFQGDDKSIDSLDKIANSTKEASDAKKEFAKATEQEAESLKKAQKEEEKANKSIVSSMQSDINNFNTKLAGFKVKPDGDHSFASWTNQITDLNSKILQYQNLLNSIKNNSGIVSEKESKEVERLKSEIKELITTMSNTPVGKRGWNDLSATKTAEKINDILEKNTKMSKAAKDQIQAYYNEIVSGHPSKPLDEILDACIKIEQEERAMGRAGKSWLDILSNKRLHAIAAQIASMFSFYDILNIGKQAANIVIKLNTNITELAKVSEATSKQIYKDFNSYAEIAKDVGGTISDTISATADWSRNGYNIPDSKELAKVAMIYENVGDGIDTDQANEYLISTIRGFKLEAKDAMDVIDAFNEVSNNEAISSGGIGEALQRSAAAFNAANTSLQESIALVTSTNSVLQSPEKVGSMWTTVSARIRGAKTELEEAGEDTEGMVESTSKLQSLIKGMTGFDILEEDGKTFKSIYDIIVGIGEKFQDLNDIDKASLLEALAGKRQSNALAATLNNIDLLKKAYGEATNAQGSAMAEQEKYQQSVQYSIDRAKASLEELANDFLSSDLLKNAIDFGDKAINILDVLIDKVGVLGTLSIGAGAALGKKGLGLTNYVIIIVYKPIYIKSYNNAI